MKHILSNIQCILCIIILCIIIYYKFIINNEGFEGGPTTGGPTTGAPTTGAPTTGGPTTGVPTTGGPTTGAPTTHSFEFYNTHKVYLYLKLNESGKFIIQMKHSNKTDLGPIKVNGADVVFDKYDDLKQWWTNLDDYYYFYNQPTDTDKNFGFGFKNLYTDDSILEEFEKQYNYLINHHGHPHTHPVQSGSVTLTNSVIWPTNKNGWPHIHKSEGLNPFYTPFSIVTASETTPHLNVLRSTNYNVSPIKTTGVNDYISSNKLLETGSNHDTLGEPNLGPNLPNLSPVTKPAGNQDENYYDPLDMTNYGNQGGTNPAGNQGETNLGPNLSPVTKPAGNQDETNYVSILTMSGPNLSSAGNQVEKSNVDYSYLGPP